MSDTVGYRSCNMTGWLDALILLPDNNDFGHFIYRLFLLLCWLSGSSTQTLTINFTTKVCPVRMSKFCWKTKFNWQNGRWKWLLYEKRGKDCNCIKNCGCSGRELLWIRMMWSLGKRTENLYVQVNNKKALMGGACYQKLIIW